MSLARLSVEADQTQPDPIVHSLTSSNSPSKINIQTRVESAIDALTKFIPVEVLAPYLAITQAIKPNERVLGLSDVSAYWFFAVLSMVFFIIFKYASTMSRKVIVWPNLSVVLWRAIAAGLAFCAWALLVPDAPYLKENTEVATILALLISPLLVAIDTILVRVLQDDSSPIQENSSTRSNLIDDRTLASSLINNSLDTNLLTPLSGVERTMSNVTSVTGVMDRQTFIRDVPKDAELQFWIEVEGKDDATNLVYLADATLIAGDKSLSQIADLESNTKTSPAVTQLGGARIQNLIIEFKLFSEEINQVNAFLSIKHPTSEQVINKSLRMIPPIDGSNALGSATFKLILES